jgi:hypothetical protein
MIKDIPFSNLKLTEKDIINFLNCYSGIIAEETNIDPNTYIEEGDIVKLPSQPNVCAIVEKITYYNFSVSKKYIIKYKILADVKLEIYKL